MARSKLDGKVVLITGAARGIGAELARQCARRGARLSLVGAEPDRLDALARELGAEHRAFECDVTDQDTLARAVAGTLEAFGRIDTVVANAGIANNGTLSVNPPDALARTIEVNLIGVMRTASATLDALRSSRGYFLIISSASAIAAMPGMAAYAASKIGVEHFGSSLRLEVAHHGVAVGVAYPCWIATDLVRDQQQELAVFEEMRRRLPGPLRSVTSVEDCATALVGAIEHRKRSVFIPRSLAPIALLRTLLWSAPAQWVMARDAREIVPRIEEEVRALGRFFGSHSVERDGAERGDAEGENVA